ncbi:unnamed protein product [Tilletia caries]|nr:unnamed protein product [Tilletia caries]
MFATRALLIFTSFGLALADLDCSNSCGQVFGSSSPKYDPCVTRCGQCVQADLLGFLQAGRATKEAEELRTR